MNRQHTDTPRIKHNGTFDRRYLSLAERESLDAAVDFITSGWDGNKKENQLIAERDYVTVYVEDGQFVFGWN